MSASNHKMIFIPDPRNTEAERRFYEEQARRLRSRAFGAAWGRAARILVGLVGGSVRSVQRRRAEQAAYDELAALDDRMLRDIGIERGDIWNVVRGEPRAARETETGTQGRRRGRPVPGARRSGDRRQAA